MKARVIYLLLCAALLAGIVAADSGTGAAYQPTAHTLSANTFTYYAVGQDHSLYAWGDRYSQAPSLEEAVPVLEDIVSVDAGWRAASPSTPRAVFGASASICWTNRGRSPGS